VGDFTQQVCGTSASTIIPVVVLAGCSTVLAACAGSGAGSEGETALPGLARSLLDHGVPAVLAMNASVGDRYATHLQAHNTRSSPSHNVLTRFPP
jgi:CHAT domain